MTTHTDLIANLRSRSSKAGRIKVLSHGFFIALEPWRALTANVLADRREPIGEASSPKGDGRAAG